jgi:Skp family chaperone for outer membrane proteins
MLNNEHILHIICTKFLILFSLQDVIDVCSVEQQLNRKYQMYSKELHKLHTDNEQDSKKLDKLTGSLNKIQSALKYICSLKS